MTRREWASAGFGAAALALSILAGGGAPRWSQAVIALCTAIAVAAMVKSRRVPARRSPLLVLIGMALVLTLVQLLPLPRALIEWLNPTGAALRADGAALFGVSPGSTISLDHPGTLSAACYFLVLLGVAIVAMRLALSERGRYTILGLVAALCGLAAIVTGIDELVDAPYFLYKLAPPLQGVTRTAAPFLNNNHFGCLMAVGTVLSFALVVYRRQPAWLRAVWLGNAAVCGLEMMNTYSRGAALALGIGSFALVAALTAQRFIAHDTPRRRRASLLTSQLPIGVVAVCTVIVVLYAGSQGVSQQLSATKIDELHAPRSKFAAWRSAFTLIEETPWVGVGRGAMEPAFTHVHPASAYAQYSHLENEYLQVVVDYGIPGALLLGLAALWLGVTALRRWRDGPLAAGALGASAAVLIQSNVDFGAEILGIAVPITAIVATLAYVPLTEGSSRTLTLARSGRMALVAGLVLGAAMLLSSATRSVQEDNTDLARAKNLALADVRGPIERHPLDYFPYKVAAGIAIQGHDPNAIRLLNHALVLDPYAPSLHLMAAHLLYETKHLEQAAIEYATALPTLRDYKAVLKEVATRFPPDIAASAIPIDIEAIRVFASSLDELGRTDIKVAWLQHVLDRQPAALQACDLLYETAGHTGDAAIIAIARRRCGSYQPTEDLRLALAKALAPKHADIEVAQLLTDVEGWRGPREQRAEAWLLLCDAQTALSKWDDAIRCLHRLDASGLVPVDRAPELAGRLEKIRDQRAAEASGSGSAHP